MLLTSGKGKPEMISVGIGISCSALASARSLAASARPFGPSFSTCFLTLSFSSLESLSESDVEGSEMTRAAGRST
jgi:hypothetical protein